MRFCRLFLLVFLLVFLVVLSGCHSPKPTPQKPPVDVAVQIIEKKTMSALFEYIGVIQSSHEVEMRARVTGYLETIGYVEGSFVKKDDLLFQIDPRPFQAALSKANAQLAREKAVLWQAQRAVSRFTPLYEQKAASQRDLDNAIASQMSAEAQVMEAQALVADAEINLSYTTIRSPVSGLTSQAKYRVGALISPSQDNMTTVSVVDPIWVVFSVSEEDVLESEDEIRKKRMVFPAQNQFAIEVVLGDQSLYPEIGIVNFASPSYSQKTGTMMIRAVLPNPNNILRPGQFVRVRIHGATRPDAIAVPQPAVQQGKQGSFVFVADANNKAVVRSVVPGPWAGNNWIIWEGLNPGDRVVVSGVNKLLAGDTVKVIEEVPLVIEQKVPEKVKKQLSDQVHSQLSPLKAIAAEVKPLEENEPSSGLNHQEIKHLEGGPFPSNLPKISSENGNANQ